MKHEFFDRGNPPEKVYRGFVRRVKPGEDVHCTVVSPVFWNCHVHWMGRTVPCPRDRGHCIHCKTAIPRKYLGYLYVRNESNGKYEHLELPLDASHDLLDAIGKEMDLRGVRFHAKRRGGKKTGIVFDLKARLEQVAPGFELPSDKAPDEILGYLWQINAAKLHLWGGNDLPPQGEVA